MDHGFPKAETFLWRRIVVGEQAQGHFAERGLGLYYHERHASLRHNNCQTTVANILHNQSRNASIPSEPPERCIVRIKM
jgi:hypothetical protein